MLKLLRKFYKGEKYVQVDEDWDGQIEDAGRIVIFRGEVWQWQFYNQIDPPYDYELIYSLVKEEYLDGVTVEHIVGSADWKAPSCDCGSAAVNDPGHAPYCSSLVEDWS